MNILEFLQSEGVAARAKSQSEYSSPCPVCGGNDRFTIWPDRNRWHCRGCNKAGDLIELVQSCKGMSFPDACRFIGEDWRIDPAKSPDRLATNAEKAGFKQQFHLWQPKEAMTPFLGWTSKAQALIDWSHEHLLNSPEQLNWLQIKRGISLEAVKRFKLGWNPKDLFRDRKAWDLPEELSQSTGKPKKLFIPAGLVIPGHDSAGGINLVKIRRPNPPEGQARYYFLPGGVAAPCFFGNSLSSFIVVESELDAVLLAQESAWVLTAVSTGSATNRPDSKSFQILSRADCLIISLDNDEAGGKAGVNFWPEIFPDASLDFIPSTYGKDHTAAYLAGFPLARWLRLRMKQHHEPIESDKTDNNVAEVNDHAHVVLFESEAANLLQETPQARCNQIILAALVLSDKLKTQGLNHEAEQLDILLEVVDRITETEPQQNMTAALYYLESFLERYRHAG
ncbi:MAG: primase-helicase zinc-binding domain-containing protein [Candidatus Riflebacteria bacterium]|nr:primase-helicase zinc-binding domain-containing protein [Candidatus Riflebacteria bacterium]